MQILCKDPLSILEVCERNQLKLYFIVRFLEFSCSWFLLFMTFSEHFQLSVPGQFLQYDFFECCMTCLWYACMWLDDFFFVVVLKFFLHGCFRDNFFPDFFWLILCRIEAKIIFSMFSQGLVMFDFSEWLCAENFSSILSSLHETCPSAPCHAIPHCISQA